MSIENPEIIQIETFISDLLMTLAEGDKQTYLARKSLSSNRDYNPNTIFKALSSNKNQEKINSDDIIFFLQKRGVNCEKIDAKLLIFFYDQDHDNCLSYAEIFNLLGNNIDFSIKYNRNDKISPDLDKSLKIFLEQEIILCKNILILLKKIKFFQNINIHDIFHLLKDYAFITEESINSFLIKNGKKPNKYDIQNIFKRLDINKDETIDFCEFHAFFGFPDCGYCCPCTPCKNCGTKCCDKCLEDVPCYLLGCDHENSKLKCSSISHFCSGICDYSGIKSSKNSVIISKVVNGNKTNVKISDNNINNSMNNSNNKSKILCNSKENKILNSNENITNKNSFKNNIKDSSSLSSVNESQIKQFESTAKYNNTQKSINNQIKINNNNKKISNELPHSHLIYEIKTDKDLYKKENLTNGTKLSDTLFIREGGDRKYCFKECNSLKCSCNPFNNNYQQCHCCGNHNKEKKSLHKKSFSNFDPFSNYESPYSIIDNNTSASKEIYLSNKEYAEKIEQERKKYNNKNNNNKNSSNNFQYTDEVSYSYSQSQQNIPLKNTENSNFFNSKSSDHNTDSENIIYNFPTFNNNKIFKKDENIISSQERDYMKKVEYERKKLLSKNNEYEENNVITSNDLTKTYVPNQEENNSMFMFNDTNGEIPIEENNQKKLNPNEINSQSSSNHCFSIPCFWHFKMFFY